MDLDTDRRRFLELTGVGAMLPFAGCSSLQDGGEQPSGETDRAPAETTLRTDDGRTATETRGASADTATVTLAIRIDQEALQERQTELQEELQNGTIDRTEAREQLRSFRTDLIADGIDGFREAVDDDPSITVDDAVTPLGVLLISGNPASLIDTLSDRNVRGLFPETTFRQAKAQARSGDSQKDRANAVSSDVTPISGASPSCPSSSTDVASVNPSYPFSITSSIVS